MIQNQDKAYTTPEDMINRVTEAKKWLSEQTFVRPTELNLYSIPYVSMQLLEMFPAMIHVWECVLWHRVTQRSIPSDTCQTMSNR